jgi:hypothetical protein
MIPEERKPLYIKKISLPLKIFKFHETAKEERVFRSVNI